MSPAIGRKCTPAGLILAVLTGCGSPSPPAAVEPSEARRELESRGLSPTAEEFRRHYMSGDVDTVRLLLAAGIDPDLDRGRALALAAARGWVEIMRLLLDAGADPVEDVIRREEIGPVR